MDGRLPSSLSERSPRAEPRLLPECPELLATVESVRRRLTRSLQLRWGSRALAAAGLLWGPALAVLPSPALPAAPLALALAALLAGILAAHLRRPSLVQAARALDRRFELQAEAVTALQRTLAEDERPLVRLLVRSCSSRLAELQPFPGLVPALPWRSWLVALLVAGSALGLRTGMQPQIAAWLGWSPVSTEAGAGTAGHPEPGLPGSNERPPGSGTAAAALAPGARVPPPAGGTGSPSGSPDARAGLPGTGAVAAPAEVQPPEGAQGSVPGTTPGSGSPGSGSAASARTGPAGEGAADRGASEGSGPGGRTPAPAGTAGSGAPASPLVLDRAAGEPGGSPSRLKSVTVPATALLVSPGAALGGGPRRLPLRYAPVVERYLQAGAAPGEEGK